MAIKGSATIELTNADGSKEIIKHDNMITNAVNDMCISQRGEMAAILKIVNNNDSYAQALFGGLLLFNETLNNDPNDYFIPTTKIIGYASQDAYAGLDIARGSFNASEGGIQSDGSYKFVWDFSTSQANGQIKSLALCPNIMGQIGASDTIVTSEKKNIYVTNDLTAPFNSYGRMLSDSGSTAGISNYCFCVVAVVDDIAYAMDYYNVLNKSDYSTRHISSNGGILKLYKFKLGATSISLADRVCRATYIGCEDITLPSEFLNVLNKSYDYCSFSNFFDYETGKLILTPCSISSGISPNGTTKYIEIDLKNNMTISTYTFTNNTTGTIAKNGYSLLYYEGAMVNLFVCKDYIVSSVNVSGVYKMYVTKRSDNTQVVEVKYSNGNYPTFTSSSYALFRPLFVNKNMLVFMYDDKSGSSFEKYFYILDMNTGIIKCTNANNLSIDNMLDIGSRTVYARCFSYLQYRLMVNPFIITTKNNLDTPVTKTASQTMKITYTLSEVDESEVV